MSSTSFFRFSAIIFFACFTSLYSFPVRAQSAKISYRLSHPVAANSSGKTQAQPLSNPAIGSYKVLAVMVDFQSDTDTKTTGNGQFAGLDYLQPYGNTIIDPLPHDKAYFERKLRFLQNYYQTVSDGKVQISYDVPDKIYHLSKQMKDYTPPREGSDLTALAKMLEETWQIVDAESPEINFSEYNCFMVFHAGVGRDVNLVSITGVDLTPYDLPSITFNLSTLKKVFGNSFQGFPVDGGSFYISNTAVLPQTESREVEAIGGNVLLELSTNGLVVASFASYLGLPDLFNTDNGRSGIGRFGLADGEGIFNYNGILPPEPSAWERIYLGWAQPVELTGTDNTISLPAQGLHQNSSAVIYKVPISSREYFLIENRQHNAKGLGVTLTRYLNGITSEISFIEDKDDFYYLNTEAIDGNIVASTNYDWTIPAGKVSAENSPSLQVDGGILVWHIDEDIIAANISANRINAVTPKGVYLLEADGAQDIGQNYDITSPANGAQSGTPLDYFFNGNPSPLYKNLIDATTYPDTKSNGKAESNITIQDFSAPAPVMTARVTRSGMFVQALDGFPLQIDNSFNRLSGIAALKYSPGYSLFLNSADGRAYTKSVGTTGSAALVTDGTPVAGKKIAAGTFGAVSVRDSTVFFFTGTQSPSRNIGSPITTPPVIDTLAKTVAVGTKDGHIIRLSLAGSGFDAVSSTPVSSQPIISLAGAIVVARDKAVFGTTTWSFGSLKAKSAVATGNASGWVGAALTETCEALLLYADGTMKTIHLSSADTISTEPVIAEIEHRGGRVLLAGAGRKLYAYNEQGNPVTNFPIDAGSQVTGSPVVADIDGDTFEEVLVSTAAGKLIAFNRFGEKLFSLALAQGSESSPTVVPVPDGDGLYLFTVDRVGLLQGYYLPKASKNVQWSSLYSDLLNRNSYTPETTSNRTPVIVTDLMPEKSVYNWPNPASEETRFRFYLTKPASVTVRVFDLTGVKMWEKSVQGSANMDNEILWTLSSVQSGIYYGIVTAKADGKSQTAKLKIAIAK